MDSGQTQKICQLIAGLMMTDGELEEREQAFLVKVFDALQLPVDERGQIQPTGSPEEAAREIAGMDESTREAALDLLLKAAWVDDAIAAKEHEYLQAITRAMGMDDDELAARLCMSGPPARFGG